MKTKILEPEEVEIYPKKSFGDKSKDYLEDLKQNYNLGKISASTYERIIKQYYNMFF